MCPSPLCGGFFASRANQPSTRCLDGRSRTACYVADVDLGPLPRAARLRARQALSSGRVLLAGRFVQRAGAGIPGLARLTASAAWLAAAPGSTAGPVWRVVDTGVRCIRAPCFSFRATLLNGTRALTLSDVHLDPAGAPSSAVARARALLARGGVLVGGAVAAHHPDEGRTLTASQLWLPA